MNREKMMWRHRKLVRWRRRQRLEWYIYKPENTKDCWQHQKLEEGHEAVFPQSHRMTNTADPQVLADIQNCERIKFCCFKPLRLILYYSSFRILRQILNIPFFTDISDDFVCSFVVALPSVSFGILVYRLILCGSAFSLSLARPSLSISLCCPKSTPSTFPEAWDRTRTRSHISALLHSDVDRFCLWPVGSSPQSWSCGCTCFL